MTETVDIGEVLDIIDKLVEEFGEDYTASARYVDWGTNAPICGVGHVLCTLGVNPYELRTTTSPREISLSINLTLGARVVLDAFQTAQDGSGEIHPDLTWGNARDEAYRAAERFLELIPPRLVRRELVDSMEPADELVSV